MYNPTRYRKLILVIFILCMLSIFYPSCFAQSVESLLNEIGEDWSTDIILVFVETPNKFDRTYGTNITDKAVLDEMSAIEEAMDPQKDDYGENDDITFVLSISTLIKEINVAPHNIGNAIEDELNPVFDIPVIPGEYAIPDDQEDIDHIVSQIPDDSRQGLVIDTNEDGIWDTAGIIMGVRNGDNKMLLNRLDHLIEDYYIDTKASSGDYNSEAEWWERVDIGEVHCTMTNLGYVKSHEYYDQSNDLNLLLSIIIIIILIALLLILNIVIKPPPKNGNDMRKNKNRILSITIIFLILICVCIPFAFIKAPISQPDKLKQYSEDVGGGQIGMVVVRGLPVDESVSYEGMGSMKDIEVLNEIEDLEGQIRGVENLPINTLLSVVDVMKMIRIPESVNESIPWDVVPPIQEETLSTLIDNSFWDAIDIVGQNDSDMWEILYGKTQQDSIISIFYESISIEMRNFLVNEDYSKALIYMQIPLFDEDSSNSVSSMIDHIIDNHPAGSSTSNFVLVGSEDEYSKLFSQLKTIFLITILIVGIVLFIFFYYILRKGGKGDKQGKKIQSENEHQNYNYPPKV